MAAVTRRICARAGVVRLEDRLFGGRGGRSEFALAEYAARLIGKCRSAFALVQIDRSLGGGSRSRCIAGGIQNRCQC